MANDLVPGAMPEACAVFAPAMTFIMKSQGRVTYSGFMGLLHKGRVAMHESDRTGNKKEK